MAAKRQVKASRDRKHYPFVKEKSNSDLSNLKPAIEEMVLAFH